MWGPGVGPRCPPGLDLEDHVLEQRRGVEMSQPPRDVGLRVHTERPSADTGCCVVTQTPKDLLLNVAWEGDPWLEPEITLSERSLCL